MGLPEFAEAHGFEDALLADGLDTALIGFGTVFHHAVAIYDFNLCVEVMVKRDGMTEDDAIEFLEFNTTGAFVGPHTPVFLRSVNK